jgi:hypothetical protein
VRGLLALLAAVGAAGAGHAQTLPSRDAAPIAGPRLALAAPGHPYASAYIAPPAFDGEARTALDYSIAPAGLAASLGFVCDNDGRAPALHDVAALAGSQPGRLLGTTIRMGF